MKSTPEISKLNLDKSTGIKPGENIINKILERSTTGLINIEWIIPVNDNILDATNIWNKTVQKPKITCKTPRSKAKLWLDSWAKWKTCSKYCISNTPKNKYWKNTIIDIEKSNLLDRKCVNEMVSPECVLWERADNNGCL